MVEYVFKINCVSVYVLECLIIVMRVILYIYEIKKKKTNYSINTSLWKTNKCEKPTWYLKNDSNT